MVCKSHAKSHLNGNANAAYSDKSACSIASGGSSSIGGNSTATLGNDFPSLSTSDDFPDDIEFSANYGKAFLPTHTFTPSLKLTNQHLEVEYKQQHPFLSPRTDAVDLFATDFSRKPSRKLKETKRVFMFINFNVHSKRQIIFCLSMFCFVLLCFL